MHRSGFSRFAASVTLSLLLAMMGPTVHALAQPASIAKGTDAGQVAQDIASAGRLRMQSQRLAKLYL